MKGFEVFVFASNPLNTIRLRCSAGSDWFNNPGRLDDSSWSLADAVGNSGRSCTGGGSEYSVFSASRSHCLILQQLCPLPLKICSYIRSGEGLHDVGLELECQLVLDLARRRGVSKQTWFSRGHMLIHNSFCHCLFAKERNL